MNLRTETTHHDSCEDDEEQFGKNFEDIFGKAWYDVEEKCVKLIGGPLNGKMCEYTGGDKLYIDTPEGRCLYFPCGDVAQFVEIMA